MIKAAQAADVLFPLKAPPEIPDLTFKGISFIGLIDISAQYQQNGAPYVGAMYSGAAMITPMNRSPQWLFVPNQAIQSFVGFKIEEAINSDLKFIARGEIGINPTTGEISDALKSLQVNNGIALDQQNFNGDGSRAGQLFNGELYAGFQSNTLGTIRVGRSNSIGFDMLVANDPLMSYGFSLFGYVSLLGGEGSAETVRVDNSIRYANSVGPFRMQLMYAAPRTNVKDFFQGTVGFAQQNYSIDFIGGHTSDTVTSGALSGPDSLGSSYLGARVYDTDMYGFFAKYTFDVGGFGPLVTPESKLTVSGGFTRLVMSNPADGGWGVGHATIGGYQLGPDLSTTGSTGAGIVNYAFTGGDRIVDMAYIAGKYQYDPQLALALAYYRYNGNSFGFGVNQLAGITAPSYSNTKCSSSAFSNCSGTEQVVSFRADYKWTKNLVLYGGVAYSRVDGGFAFGYLKNSTYNPTVGMRLSF